MKRMAMARRRRRAAGFTLMELMISLLLVSLVVGMLMQSAVVILASFREQREALALERSARAGIDLLTEGVRNATAGVITGDLRDSAGCNDVVGVRVTNVPGGSDQIDLMYASGGIVTSVRHAVDATTTQLTVVDATALAVGDQVILANGITGRLLPVTSVTPGAVYDVVGTSTTRCSTVPMPATGFAAGALIIRGRYARLAIEPGPDGVPLLTVDGDGSGPAASEPVAEGVEDLQIAVGVDVNGDGVLDDNGDTTDEWFYNAAGDTDPPPITGGRWRAVRITVVARDLKPRGASFRPAAEDRTAGNVDGFRRRVLQARVEIRNLRAVP